jgi:hypothetical protein
MAESILLQTSSERAKRIQEFREETIPESPAVLRAEIIMYLEQLRHLDRFAAALKGGAQ